MKKISLERINARRFDKDAEPLTERQRQRREYQRAYMRNWRKKQKPRPPHK